MIISSARVSSVLRRVALTTAGVLAFSAGLALAQSTSSSTDTSGTQTTQATQTTSTTQGTTTQSQLAATTTATTTTTTTTSTTTTPTPTPSGPKPPTRVVSWNARVLAPVYARANPSPSAKKVMFVNPIAPYTHGPTVLLVLDQKVVDDISWTKVLLPKRPNGSAGWVRSDYLRFWKQRMRIVIDQSARMTFVYRDGKVVYRTRNAVGKPETPTPNGYYAIAEKAFLPSWGFLGPVVLVTTGYSEVLNEYAGGNGRFALHGTSQPWLIGTRASHGCIRHRNSSIVTISKMVGLGTPVRIHA